MCGIFGLINKNTTREDVTKILDFNHQYIQSRGPDSFGKHVFSTSKYIVGILHSRLAIIDLSQDGKQPMHCKWGDWSIAFNGEIFNYLELRSELVGLGYSFSGHSDTEVLLLGWAHWGLEVLPKLNGMFAFAIVNNNTGSTWLIRDRYGIKPLFWANKGPSNFIYSSSVLAVANCSNADIDENYCARGVAYKFYDSLGSESPYTNVHSIKPGCWLRLDLGEQGIKETHGCWYSLKLAVELQKETLLLMGDEQIYQKCQDLFEDSLRLRLRSDVPISVTLSDGIDSSLITAYASNYNKNLHSFTFGSKIGTSSEGAEALILANKYCQASSFIGGELNKSSLTNLLEQTLSMQEAPFSGLSVLAQNLLYQSIHDAGFKVTLGGQGGDEVFGGYRKYLVIALNEFRKNQDTLKNIHSFLGILKVLIGEIIFGSGYLGGAMRYTGIQNNNFIALDMRYPHINILGNSSDFSGRQIEDFDTYSLPTLLRYEDRNSMGHGVESRLPFLDHRLVEFGLSIPTRFKVSNGYSKNILRVMGRGKVPDSILLNRRKRGFDVKRGWVKDGIGASLRECIIDNKLKLSPYLRKGLNLSKEFSDSSLDKNENLLDEALMLAWLINPIGNGRSHG